MIDPPLPKTMAPISNYSIAWFNKTQGAGGPLNTKERKEAKQHAGKTLLDDTLVLGAQDTNISITMNLFSQAPCITIIDNKAGWSVDIAAQQIAIVTTFGRVTPADEQRLDELFETDPVLLDNDGKRPDNLHGLAIKLRQPALAFGTDGPSLIESAQSIEIWRRKLGGSGNLYDCMATLFNHATKAGNFWAYTSVYPRVSATPKWLLTDNGTTHQFPAQSRFTSAGD